MNYITVYDGASGKFKGDFAYSMDSLELVRDLTQIKTSKIKVSDPEKIIKAQDLLSFLFGNGLRWGKIKTATYNQSTCDISFAFGADSHQVEIFTPYITDSEPRIYRVDNKQDLTVSYEPKMENIAPIAPDFILDYDTIFRQFMRRRPHLEVYSFKNIFITPFDFSGSETTISSIQNIRLDNPVIMKDMVFEVADDRMTWIVLIDKNTPQGGHYREYEMLTDGSIVRNATGIMGVNSIRPQIIKFFQVEREEADSLEYATSLFRQQEYQNEIEIEMPLDNNIINIYGEIGKYGYTNKLVDDVLGRNVRLFLPNSTSYIDSMISGYEIKRGVLKIIFGLTRTRLTDILNLDRRRSR